jgi:hypothetical protein
MFFFSDLLPSKYQLDTIDVLVPNIHCLNSYQKCSSCNMATSKRFIRIIESHKQNGMIMSLDGYT